MVKMEENLQFYYKKVISVPYIQLEEETASYYTEKVEDTLYIYLECSNGKTDWKNNLDFPAKPYGDMKHRWYVHRGFLKVWKVIRDQIKETIQDISLKRIVIVGYSHGAALAVLCHEYCVFNRQDIKDNIFGYGFGCPRVVWGILKKSIKERFKNFTIIRNHNDVVTHVPPKIFLFRHVGKMLKIGKNKEWNPVDSHRPQNYTESLREEDL